MKADFRLYGPLRLIQFDDAGRRAVSILVSAVEGNEGVMARALVTALHESCGYLQDEGWHQTARLMTLAAHEIERLSERVRELESSSAARNLPPAEIAQRIVPIAAGSHRPR